MTIKTICVFCASREGNDPWYVKTAYEMGKELAQHNKILVYGDGSVGLMGSTVLGVIDHNGHAQGHSTTTIASFEKPLKHKNITNHMHATLSLRKSEMMKQSDAFIALPGGIGTFDEIADVMCALHVGEIKNKPLILVGKRYWGPYYKALRNGWKAGFIAKELFSDFVIVDSPKAALKYVSNKSQLLAKIKESEAVVQVRKEATPTVKKVETKKVDAKPAAKKTAVKAPVKKVETKKVVAKPAAKKTAVKAPVKKVETKKVVAKPAAKKAVAKAPVKKVETKKVVAKPAAKKAVVKAPVKKVVAKKK